MKNNFRIIFTLFILISCNSNRNKNINTIPESENKIHDTIYFNNNYNDWQQDFGLTHDPDKDSIWNKPVSFYLNDENCSGIALDFYYGQFRPSDNAITDELLKLSSTKNNKLRPFYRWCLNYTIIISDGALGEHTGSPALAYAEKFPDEFFEYLDIETSNDKYEMWLDAISYSGLSFYDKKDNKEINRKSIEGNMLKNLKSKSSNNVYRVKKFALDCVSK